MKEISREEAERFINDSQILRRELNQIGKELQIRFRLANNKSFLFTYNSEGKNKAYFVEEEFSSLAD
jgi:hypothetical protein